MCWGKVCRQSWRGAVSISFCWTSLFGRNLWMSHIFGTFPAFAPSTMPTLYATWTARGKNKKVSTLATNPVFEESSAVIFGWRWGVGLQCGIYCSQLVLCVWSFAIHFSKGKTQKYLLFCAVLFCVCTNETRSSFSLPLDRSMFEMQPWMMN